MKEITFETNESLKKLVMSLVCASSPEIRQAVSEVSAYFDGVFSKIFNVLQDSSSGETHYIQSEGLPSVMINGVEFPYIRLNAITKRSLATSGLHYKDHWKYKFWHSPNEQFELLRKADRLASGALVKPIAMVLNDSDEPTGYIMKRAEGRTLLDLMESKSLSYTESLEVQSSLVKTIDNLHSKGIGHGDLNKENIFLRSASKIELIDPLESVPPEKAMEFDRAWLKYLSTELDKYRLNIS